MNRIALPCLALNEEEYTTTQPDNIIQIELLVKRILRNGENSCRLFLDELRNNGFIQQMRPMFSQPKLCNSNCFLTKDIIHQHYDYICQNLQIAMVLDILFERNIISIDDHDHVQTQGTKPEKRQALLDLLLSRHDTSWIDGFVRTLRLTGHDTLLENLRHAVNSGQALTVHQGFRLGSTTPDQTVDFVARLTSNHHQEVQLNDILQADIDVMQECLDAGVIEIWEGSIYFHLSTSTPNTILSILNGDDARKLVLFLRRLFKGNQSILRQFTTDTIITFELEEKPVDLFLGSCYGKKRRSSTQAHDTKSCSACFQAVVRTNYDTILGEIEDDIIDDTLRRLNKSRSKNPPMYKTNGCQLGKKTRYEKAVAFLQYVICNEDVLVEFKKSFAYRSQVVLKPVKCRACLGEKGALVPLKSQKRVFHFTICSNVEGDITIQNITSNLRLPSIIFRTTEQPGRQLQRVISRAMSTVEIPTLQMECRIVVIGETKGKAQFLTSAKRSRMLKFNQLPSLHKESVGDDEDRKRMVAYCIARTSPGPHAFIFFIDSVRHSEVSHQLNPYIKYFGPDFMQFLVLIFDTEVNDVLVNEMIDKSLPLQNILTQCAHRFLVLHNKTIGDEMCNVLRLLEKLLLRMQSENQRPYYSSDIFEKSEMLLQMITKTIKSEQESTIRTLRKEIKNLQKVNPREEATDQLRFSEKFIDEAGSSLALDSDDML